MFLLDGHTPHDLSDFTQKWFDRTSESYEDEFEVYDSSQREQLFVYDAHLMAHFGVPHHIIDSHLEFMTILRTFKGPLGVMMPTGCKLTLIVNSLRTLAYLTCTYTLSSKTPALVSGDDSVVHCCPATFSNLASY